jgi:predicted RNA-binding protein with TRAM domain
VLPTERRNPSFLEAGGSASKTAEKTENTDPSGPPVDEGDVRDVTIEHLSDQGDSIAKIKHGYVVIATIAIGDGPSTVAITSFSPIGPPPTWSLNGRIA